MSNYGVPGSLRHMYYAHYSAYRSGWSILSCRQLDDALYVAARAASDSLKSKRDIFTGWTDQKRRDKFYILTTGNAFREDYFRDLERQRAAVKYGDIPF